MRQDEFIKERNESIFEKKIYCILKIKSGYLKIIEKDLTFNEAMKLKEKLTETIKKHNYFVDITLSVQNTVLKYYNDSKAFNKVIDSITRLENETKG